MPYNTKDVERLHPHPLDYFNLGWKYRRTVFTAHKCWPILLLNMIDL